MKRALSISLVALAAFAASRDAYRTAYRTWREADAALEREAGSGAAGFAPSVAKVAAAEAAYGAARSSFAKALAGENEQSLAWLEAPPGDLPGDVAKGVGEYVGVEQTLVKRNLDTFANDPDPGIQQLQGMLTRENAALASLAKAIAERQKAATAAGAANASTDQTRLIALAEYHELIGGMKQAVEDTDRQAAAWAEYYKLLAAPAGASSGPAPTAAAPSTAHAAAVTPLPLIRYTGAWTFPPNGLFHGPQPEFLDLVVHEENGQADGTLFVRFRLPPGSKDDPVLRFDFKGDFTKERVQSFPLETSDGTKGAIDLIPGPAFNLLEVNFHTDPKPGKIQQGNVVLVKR